MYRAAAVSPDDTPVILIPGLFGSKLRDRTTGVEVWPGLWSRVLFNDYGDLELKFDPKTFEVERDNLEAFDLAEVVLGKNFYGPIISALENFGGYVRATPGTPAKTGERRYYVFAYDWRQDNVEQAKKLEELINAIRKDYGDPELRVDIVAHSMQRLRKSGRPYRRAVPAGTPTPQGTPRPWARAAYQARTSSQRTSSGCVTSPLFHCACGSPDAIRRIPGISSAPPPQSSRNRPCACHVSPCASHTRRSRGSSCVSFASIRGPKPRRCR